MHPPKMLPFLLLLSPDFAAALDQQVRDPFTNTWHTVYNQPAAAHPLFHPNSPAAYKDGFILHTVYQWTDVPGTEAPLALERHILSDTEFDLRKNLTVAGVRRLEASRKARKLSSEPNFDFITYEEEENFAAAQREEELGNSASRRLNSVYNNERDLVRAMANINQATQYWVFFKMIILPSVYFCNALRCAVEIRRSQNGSRPDPSGDKAHKNGPRSYSCVQPTIMLWAELNSNAKRFPRGDQTPEVLI